MENLGEQLLKDIEQGFKGAEQHEVVEGIEQHELVEQGEGVEKQIEEIENDAKNHIEEIINKYPKEGNRLKKLNDSYFKSLYELHNNTSEVTYYNYLKKLFNIGELLTYTRILNKDNELNEFINRYNEIIQKVDDLNENIDKKYQEETIKYFNEDLNELKENINKIENEESELRKKIIIIITSFKNILKSVKNFFTRPIERKYALMKMNKLNNLISKIIPESRNKRIVAILISLGALIFVVITILTHHYTVKPKHKYAIKNGKLVKR